MDTFRSDRIGGISVSLSLCVAQECSHASQSVSLYARQSFSCLRVYGSVRDALARHKDALVCLVCALSVYAGPASVEGGCSQIPASASAGRTDFSFCEKAG